MMHKIFSIFFMKEGRLNRKNFLERLLFIEIFLFILTIELSRYIGALENIFEACFILFIFQAPFIYSRYALMCRRLYDSGLDNSRARLFAILSIISIFSPNKMSSFINFMIIGGEISIFLKQSTIEEEKNGD